jgi:hypothetical protein
MASGSCFSWLTRIWYDGDLMIPMIGMLVKIAPTFNTCLSHLIGYGGYALVFPFSSKVCLKTPVPIEPKIQAIGFGTELVQKDNPAGGSVSFLWEALQGERPG